MQLLEPRQFLSASAVGPEFKVNTFTTGDQQTILDAKQSVATDADGDFVVTWTGASQDGSSNGVYAQRYNAAGVAQGSEFRVNTFTTGSQIRPAVAMDADGDFVVTWTSSGQDGDSDGVYAKRYNETGVAQGSEFRVNSFTTGGQRNSTVAMDADGDFVVTWSSDGQDSSNHGVYAQRYNTAGVTQGGEFRVNTFTTNEQDNSTVAMDADGDFVITWSSSNQDGDGSGVYAKRYNEAGVAQGTEFRVNTHTTDTQKYSSVAMDADGDFVVTWQSELQDGAAFGYGVYAKRYNAAGVAQGGEFQVNTYTTNFQRFTTVSMDADGDFVITWSSYGQDGDNYGVYAKRYNTAGVAQGGDFRVNTITANQQRWSTVAMDADGDFVVTWTSLVQDGSGEGVYAQRYDDIGPDAADNAGPTVTDVLVAGDRLLLDEQLVTPPGSVTVVFSEDLSTTGGAGGADSVTNPANWGLTKNGVDASGLISGITFGLNGVAGKYEAVVSFTTPLTSGDYVLTAKGTSTITDLAGNALDGNADGTPGDDYTRALRVRTPQPLGNEFQVNTFTTGNQQTYAESPQLVAVDSDGDFVVTWSSFGQDGDGYGVYGQRYNAAGVTQGGEFRVNTFTTGAQQFSTVAMDADGDFVITWSSYIQDGSGYGVYAQRYNAAGVAQGTEFRVNTHTTSIQVFSTVAMDADGDFVVTWRSYGQDGSGQGIYAKRYNAAGVSQGNEFRVNTFTTGTQAYSTVAMDADGDFVVTWRSNGQDGDGYGIYAQRYNAAGMAQGSEFRVNSHTTKNQRFSTVAMDADGDFVVTWTSFGQNGSGDGVYAQRYNAAGVVQGSEFQVNSITTLTQKFSTVAMDADGDFVIAWTSDGQDGDFYGIYAQRYNAAGAVQGSEFRVNSYTTQDQRFSTVAMDADGDFVISWSSSQDGSGYGVYAQRYAGVGHLPTDISAAAVAENLPSGTPVALTTTDVDTPETFTYALVSGTGDTDNASFQIVDGQLQTAASFNFETTATRSVRLQVTDAGGLTFEKAVTISITDVNEAPTVALQNATTSLPENTSTVAATKVADIVVTDDALGTETLSLTGIHAASFEIVGTELFLNSGVVLDFETLDSYSVTVNVDDNTVGSNPDASTNYALTLTDVNEAPTAVDLQNTTSTLPENTSTAAAIKLADVVVTDDHLGTETLSLSGADSASFEIVGTEMFLKAGVVLDFETQDTYSVTVDVDDNTVDGDPDASTNFHLTLTDVNEAPTAIALQNTTTTLPENTSTASPVKVSDIVVTDDALGTETLSLTGTDAASFEIVGSELFLKAGVVLNFEAKSSYSVTVNVDDNTVGGNPDASTNYALTLTDVNDVPQAFGIAPATNEDTPLNGGLLWAFDQETPMDQLVFTISTPAAHGTVVRTGVRGFNYTPHANYHGTDSFQFTVFDGENTSAPATVSITVNSVNDLPTAFGITPVTNEDTPLNGGLLWAFDADKPIDQLVYTVSTPAAHGTVVRTGARGFNYTPHANYFGPDSFQFTVFDGQATSAPATVSITVNSVNDLPKAFDLVASIDEDTTLNSGLLWGYDAETPINSLTYTITTPTTNGVVTQTGVRGFKYVPVADFNGTDSFQYTVFDGQNTSAPATMTITVNPVAGVPAFDPAIIAWQTTDYSTGDEASDSLFAASTPQARARRKSPLV